MKHLKKLSRRQTRGPGHGMTVEAEVQPVLMIFSG